MTRNRSTEEYKEEDIVVSNAVIESHSVDDEYKDLEVRSDPNVQPLTNAPDPSSSITTATVENVKDPVPTQGETESDSEDDFHNKAKIHMKVAADAPLTERLWEVLTTFWPLGFVAFGGPQASVALLRDHLVVQRDWLDENQFLELFAIGQVRNTNHSKIMHHYVNENVIR
jgi:Chromate transporter